MTRMSGTNSVALPDGQRIHYYGIDGLRFFAALVVAVFHIGFSCWVSPTSGASKVLQGAYSIPELTPFAWFGWIGVEIFFVISGFVIAFSASNASATQFAVGRFIRLYPAVWICGTITAIFLFIDGIRPLVQKYWHSILLFPVGPYIDGQYWTLPVEMAFYTCIFAILLVGRARWIPYFALALALYSAIFQVLLISNPSLAVFTEHGGRLTLMAYGCFFALGIAFKQWATEGTKPLVVVTGSLGVFAAILEIKFHAGAVAVNSSSSPIDLSELWFVPMIIFAAACAMIVLSIKRHDIVYSWSAGRRKLLQQLGLMTYPLYLLHFSIGVGATRELTRAGIAPGIAMAMVLCVLVYAAYFVANFPEKFIAGRIRSAYKVYSAKRVGNGVR